jgi:hypothetical protein
MPTKSRYPYGTASAAIEVVKAARKGRAQKLFLADGAEVSARPLSDGSISWLVKDPDGAPRHSGIVPPRPAIGPARRVLRYLFAEFTRRLRPNRASPSS